MAEVQVLGHERIKYETFDEQGYGDYIEYKNVKNMLSIFLHIIRENVPFFQNRRSTSFSNSIQSKTLQSSHIGCRIQIILFGSPTIQTNSQKIAFKLFHHCFEIVITQGFFVFKSSRSKHTVD